jgi:phage portal protein BeeE
MGFFGKSNKKDVPQIETKAASTFGMPIITKLGNTFASYINIKERADYAKIFSTVSEVYAPINYMASAFSNMKPKLLDKEGKEVDRPDIMAKLSQPNPLTNWKDFLQIYLINKKVFGNSYIFKYLPSGFKNIYKNGALWVLPSQYVYATPTSRNLNTYYLEDDKNKYIKGYNLLNLANPKLNTTWQTNEIMHMKETNVQYFQTAEDILVNLIEGMSPLKTLREPISNIQEAYNAQNTILKKRGALGILSPKNSKDATGLKSVFTDEQKKEVQDQFQMYGLGEDQWQYIITNIEMSWQAMSVPIKELMLFEGIENSMVSICNTYNFPILLMNYLKGSTFSNLNESKKSLYQDNIIPEGNAFMSELNSFLELDKEGLKLEADFSHIPILQADLSVEAEKDSKTISTINVIQTEIFEGKISYEAGKNKLIIILGFTDEQADAMLTDNLQNGESNIQE